MLSHIQTTRAGARLELEAEFEGRLDDPTVKAAIDHLMDHIGAGATLLHDAFLSVEVTIVDADPELARLRAVPVSSIHAFEVFANTIII